MNGYVVNRALLSVFLGKVKLSCGKECCWEKVPACSALLSPSWANRCLQQLQQNIYFLDQLWTAVHLICQWGQVQIPAFPPSRCAELWFICICVFATWKYFYNSASTQKDISIRRIDYIAAFTWNFHFLIFSSLTHSLLRVQPPPCGQPTWVLWRSAGSRQGTSIRASLLPTCLLASPALAAGLLLCPDLLL